MNTSWKTDFSILVTCLNILVSLDGPLTSQAELQPDAERASHIRRRPTSMRVLGLFCASAAVASGLQLGIAPAGRATAVRMSVINESIDKENPKVVNELKVSEMKGKKAVMCRCWKSDTFPMCNGAHVKHNEATGDNVGPLIIEKDN